MPSAILPASSKRPSSSSSQPLELYSTEADHSFLSEPCHDRESRLLLYGLGFLRGRHAMKAGSFDTTGTIDQCPRGGTPLDPRPEEETSHECRISGTRTQADPVGPEPDDEYAWSPTPYLHITTSPELLV